MSLFTCPACGMQDNTAGSGFYAQKRQGVASPLCSECNPATGTTPTRSEAIKPGLPVRAPGSERPRQMG